MLINAICGFFMALADSVPGVSGGTVAYILGLYDEFINSIHNLFNRDRVLRKKAIFFLLKLGLGWVIGFVLAMLVLASLFERHIYFLSSLFLGLTASSIPFIIKEEKKELSGKYKNIVFLLLGVALVVFLTAFRSGSAAVGVIDYHSLKPLQYLYLFISGTLAISAMVLPGISGSTLLLVMGVYIPTVNAVHDFLHLDFAVFPGGLVFGLGILTGAALSIHFIRAALEKHRSAMLYFILGLMFGSLYAIVNGPTTMSIPREPLTLSSFNILAFIIGIVILLPLERLRAFAAKRGEAEA